MKEKYFHNFIKGILTCKILVVIRVLSFKTYEDINEPLK